MIDFRIKKSSALTGGLTFQFVYDKSDNRSDHSIEDFNFIDSIFVQEEAFFLIEPIFSTNESTERTPEQQRYYHWVLNNYHDLNSFEIILQQIIELQQGIQQYKNLETVHKLDLYLTKKLKKILTIRRIRYKHQNEMVNYLTGIINFIKVAIDDKDIKGIWVIGI